MMSATDIRNKIIDQLMAIKDAEFLRALSDMIARANVQEKAIQLTEEQKAMLAMSEDDIREGKTMDHFTVNERELEWLKRKAQIISPTNQFVSKARPSFFSGTTIHRYRNLASRVSTGKTLT